MFFTILSSLFVPRKAASGKIIKFILKEFVEFFLQIKTTTKR